jgi:putative ABC transport system permease protein
VTPLPRLRSWLRAVFRRRDLNREIREELEFHIERRAEDLRRQGLSPTEASRRARAELGSLDGRREAMRESLGLRLLDEIRGDVRYALRLLRRSPAFTAVAVLSLGLGIGANTAIFSILDEALLKTLPVARPDRLFFVDNSGGKSSGSNGPPYPCFEILRDRSTQFAGLAMFTPQQLRVTIDGAEERVHAQYASGNYFEILGVPAAYGRILTPVDDAPGGTGGPDGPVVVISDGFWKRRFAASPAVLGKPIRIGTKTMTIVGVTPPEFIGLTVGSPVDLTIPVTVSDNARLLTRKDTWWFSVVGRLADGASMGAARAELDGLFQSYMTSVEGHAPRPGDYFNRIELVPAARGLDYITRDFSTPLAIVMAIVGLVLIIGCANVANLLLARASARQGEMALRLAIGAGRGRLIRQLLTEGLVLAGLGAAAGLLVAGWSARLLAGMLREQIVIEPRFDGRVLAFTTTVAAFTGLCCSVVPALRSTRTARTGPDGRVSASARRRFVSQSLVIVQVTLALTLLCGAALFIRTLRNLERVDAGFRADQVLTLDAERVVQEPLEGADLNLARVQAAEVWADAADSLSRLPGVRSAAATTLAPLSPRDRGVNLAVVGGPPVDEEHRGIHLNHVTAGFFDTFAVRLVAGRLFTDADAFGAQPVAMLNRTAVRTYFGNASPIGRLVSLNAKSAPREVVGVVEDTRYMSLRDPAERMIYLPMRQPLDVIARTYLAVRASGDAAALGAAIRTDVRRSVPGAFAGPASPLTERVSNSLVRERLVSMLAGGFGVLALVLACIGLYGLLAYSVVQRTREFGVRIAVGAPRGAVVWMVLRETLALVAAALAGGVAIVLAAGRYVGSVLFDVSPADPTAIGAAAAVLVAIATIATYLPARRAGRINPTTALRHE